MLRQSITEVSFDFELFNKRKNAFSFTFVCSVDIISLKFQLSFTEMLECSSMIEFSRIELIHHSINSRMELVCMQQPMYCNK